MRRSWPVHPAGSVMKGPHGHFTPSVGGVVWSPGCRGSCTGDGQPEDPRAPGTQGQVHAQHLQEPENRHKAAFPGDSLLAKIPRSEEHTSELQSLTTISYAVFCKGMRVEGCALPPLDLLSRRHHNPWVPAQTWAGERQDRKSTRLNSSH